MKQKMDPYGRAVTDYFNDIFDHKLWVHTSYGEKEEMPVEAFFREEEDMIELDILALTLANGKILDVGAGTGVHSLILQDQGFDVTALEVSSACASVMKKSGVKKIIQADIFASNPGKFDTIYLLMNGLGLCQKLERLPNLIEKLMLLLNTGGQIIFDSSDISYLYKDYPRPDHYYGELSYQYEYRGEKSDWFDWLYVDQQTLKHIVERMGLKVGILNTNKYDQYLARIVND